MVDVGTEWRSFNNEKSCKDPSRVGAPENSLLSGSDLSTSIAIAPGGSKTPLLLPLVHAFSYFTLSLAHT